MWLQSPLPTPGSTTLRTFAFLTAGNASKHKGKSALTKMESPYTRIMAPVQQVTPFAANETTTKSTARMILNTQTLPNQPYIFSAVHLPT